MIYNNLSGKTILVIGGTSGIGLAVAKTALQYGAKVIITGRDQNKAMKTAESLGYGVQALKANIDNADDINSLFRQIQTTDHVYIAAGGTKTGSIYEVSPEDNMAAFNTRILGSLRVVKAAEGKINPGGSITFTGGVSTDRPIAGAWVSGLATATAEQLARVLVMEIPGIRFNAVSPGYTDTPMWDNIMGIDKEQILDYIAEKLPVQKIARSEEVASAVLFLMANPSVTGEVIHVDGGARLI